MIMSIAKLNKACMVFFWLKQAAILAYNFLKKNLAAYGYKQIPHTDGLWRHKTRKSLFVYVLMTLG